MKQKVKDPKVKSNSKLLPKNNNDLEPLSDELFILPFLSESLIRKQEQSSQKNYTKSKNSFLPIINQNKSPFVSNLKIIDTNKTQDLQRKTSLRKSQPNSAISNKSSKSNKSNVSNISSISNKLEYQKDLDEYKISPRFKQFGSQIIGNKFLYLTPEATSIKFQQVKRDPSRPKESRGILKNTLLAPIKDHNSKISTNIFLDKSYELFDYDLSNPNVTPELDTIHHTLPKINSPYGVDTNPKKITFETVLSTSCINKPLKNKSQAYNIQNFFYEYDQNFLNPNYIPDLFANDFKNRLSQINEESSNDTTPSLCSAWSSSFSSILSHELIENSIFNDTNNLNTNSNKIQVKSSID